MHSSIRKYCRYIRRAHIEVLRYDWRTKSMYWDLPAMASICHDGNHVQQKRGYSDNPEKIEWTNVLRKKMEILGEIGTVPNGGKYILGRCAEQHAANKFLKKYNKKHLDKLFFTESVRPRTMQVFQPCDNCKKIFQNLK